MYYADVIAAWNAQSDFMNDWSNLSEEEKVEFALSLAGKAEKQEPVANYSNWHSMCRTHDGQVFKSDPNHPSNVGTVAPCPECEKLNKQIAAYKNLTSSLEKQVAHHSAKADEYQAAIETLESERQSNSILTAESEKLKSERDELAAQVEMMRIALSSCQTWQEIKEFGPSIWHRNYNEGLVKEALALPDLSTSIMNRGRAEAPTPAGAALKHYAGHLRALATGMEAGK